MDFFDLFENNFKVVLPEIYIVLALMFLLMYGVIFSTSLTYNLPVITRGLAWLTMQTLFIALLLTLNNPIDHLIIFHGTLVHDYFTTIVKIFLLTAALCCISASFTYIRKERLNAFEYLILILIATLGMMCIVSSYDLISMYLAIEMQSLSLYVLAAFKKNSAFSTESGLKYFILGAFSSGLILFGSSMVYGFTGSTNFEDIARICTGTYSSVDSIGTGVLVGLAFIASGLLFKIAAAPFHMWSPDVYEGAPTCVSMFFAIMPKIAILGLILRLYFFSFYDFMQSWQSLFILCSFASMLVGAFGALQQKKVKRLLAYSSIGHVGYMLIGLTTGTLEGVQSVMIYIAIYMVMSLNIWTILLSLEYQGKPGRATYLSDFVCMAQMNPLMAITIALGMFSMAGVPPLAGFCAKMYIFFSAMEASMYTLATVGVLTSCVGSYYYIRLIKIMFFEKSTTWNVYAPLDREKSLLLAFTTLFICFFFAYPSPLLIATHKMALVLGL
jgi:proton-translocating NADH-quinone oxidoreductase chain N|tara:strand:+ start:165 stop:1661 length:1497 start_codon:yes stop_codon:yes gene_type:complete